MIKKVLTIAAVLGILMTLLTGCLIKITRIEEESATSAAAGTTAVATTASAQQTTQSTTVLTGAKAGGTVGFGKYEQENNFANGMETIVWRVLAVKDGKALLLADKVLDIKPYNTEKKDTTWETCTLRKWLNEDFLSTAFTSDEQAAIAETTLLNKDNDEWRTLGGNSTADKVFLLSKEEAEMYLPSDTARSTQGTVQAKNNYEISVGDDETTENMVWWLRSVGYKQYCASFVYDDGTISDASLTFNLNDVSLVCIGVRPAIWVIL